MDNFQKTEGKLVAFFKAKAKGKLIKGILETIQKRINKIERDLADLKINIPVPSFTANYSNVVVTGGEQISHMERALIRQEESLYSELARLKIRHARLRQKSRELDSKWEGMEIMLSTLLDEEEMLIAENKYSNLKMSYREIARMLEQETGIMRSPNTIKEKREKIVNKIAKELRVV